MIEIIAESKFIVNYILMQHIISDISIDSYDLT